MGADCRRKAAGPKGGGRGALLQTCFSGMTGATLRWLNTWAHGPARLLVWPRAAAEAGLQIPKPIPDNEQFLLRRTDAISSSRGQKTHRRTRRWSRQRHAVAESSVPARAGAGSIHGTMTRVCVPRNHGARSIAGRRAKYLNTPRQARFASGFGSHGEAVPSSAEVTRLALDVYADA